MSFAPTSTKEEIEKASTTIAEYFPDIPSKIPFLGPESVDPLSYRFYNAEEEIAGKKMKVSTYDSEELIDW